MPAAVSRVIRETEYLQKKLSIFKAILKQKDDWEMKEHLFEQTRAEKEAEYAKDLEKQKIKQLGVTVKRAKPKKRTRKKKDKTPYAEVDAAQEEGAKSEDDLSSSFEDQKKCYRILSMMMKHDFARPFLQPVDWVKFKIPDYPQVIKNPMDLGTIKKQLRDGTITDLEEFVAKMRLTFRNAKIFNPASNLIHKWAIALEKVFDRKLSTIDRAHSQEMKKEHEKAKRAQQIMHHEQDRAKQRAKRSEYKDRKSKEVTNPYVPSAKRKKTNPVQKPFTKKQIVAPDVFDEEEIENLRLMISDLPSEKLGGLLEILDVHEPDGEELALDLDMLSSTQLRDLYLFCRETLGWNARRPAKKEQKRTLLEQELNELQRKPLD